MFIDVDQRRAVAELKRDNRAADAVAAAAVRAARADEKRCRRMDRAEARRAARADRAVRRSERWAMAVALGRRLRPVAPLLIVTGFAMYGQIAYGLVEYSPDTWPLQYRLIVAVGAAVGVESIALYVAWHAHDALLQKASSAAARLRRASYLIALAVAGVNYAHFSDGWKPTPGAVVFALFSAASPWLWGLHTRRAQHMQLLREGHADSAGAVFSAERFRAFPLRTMGARRWSIDHGVSDPRAAWEGYKKDRAAEADRRSAERTALAAARSGTWQERLAEWLTRERAAAQSDRRIIGRASNAVIIADARQWAADRGRPPSRDEMLAAYGIGSPRCGKLRRELGWADAPTGADR